MIYRIHNGRLTVAKPLSFKVMQVSRKRSIPGYQLLIQYEAATEFMVQGIYPTREAATQGYAAEQQAIARAATST